MPDPASRPDEHDDTTTRRQDRDAALTLDREFAADPGSVWEAITTDAGFSSWSGAGSEIDPRPGGLVRTPDDATGRERAGAVETVDAPRHMRYRWWPLDDPDEVSTVDIELTPAGAGTHVRIVERLVLPTGAPRCSAWPARVEMLGRLPARR